jgi:hypothetical protein
MTESKGDDAQMTAVAAEAEPARPSLEARLAALGEDASLDERLAVVDDDEQLFEPQVAALFRWRPRTVKRYRLSGHLPPADGHEPPPGRPWTGQPGSGPESAWWYGRTIREFAPNVQPPGRPRNDGRPRQRHAATPARPGPGPGQPAGVTAVRRAVKDLGGQATDAEILRYLSGQGSRLTAEQVRAALVSLGRRRGGTGPKPGTG